MKFGIVFPNSAKFVDTELAVRSVTTAEESGFEFFLSWDHYMLPRSDHTFETWILLSHLAAKTSKIRLGTCVTPIPFRPPAMLAKMVATLDQLSDGRLILGVGAGWHRPEFDGFSKWDDDRTRVAKTREGLELMIRLWQESVVDFTGKFYIAKHAAVEPKPKQMPHPPLWFGTTGDYMLKLAAKYGDGWIPTMISPSSYEEYATRIRRMLSLSPSPKQFAFAYDLYDPLRSAQEYSGSIEEFRRAGCEYYGINWKYKKEECIDRIKWFGKEVIPSFN